MQIGNTSFQTPALLAHTHHAHTKAWTGDDSQLCFLHEKDVIYNYFFLLWSLRCGYAEHQSKFQNLAIFLSREKCYVEEWMRRYSFIIATVLSSNPTCITQKKKKRKKSLLDINVSPSAEILNTVVTTNWYHSDKGHFCLHNGSVLYILIEF